MIQPPRHPLLYQINTRVWLTELSATLGRAATLDDIPDAELDRLAAAGLDWIWLLSVWRTGPAARRISRSHREWRHEYIEALPDLKDADIGGSGFAITAYNTHPNLGGDPALARIRRRLQQRGLRLMLDFVPNHTAPDHRWVEEHPEYYVAGTESDLAEAPQNFARVQLPGGNRVLAFGRDPYFPGWPDTFQLDYSNPATQNAMRDELVRIAQQCDGVRCDMAMLVLPEVFESTWGRRAPSFWPETLQAVREKVPGFCFLAEVYWDLEATMHEQGFDYAYDKRLYDRLREGHARPVREHLLAGLEYQSRLARFLENHDEPRAATAFPAAVREAAAIVTYFTPGLRFFHQGQFEGRRKRISPHLVRGPRESMDRAAMEFYERLLSVLRDPTVRGGEWRLLDCTPAWDGNGTQDAFMAWLWTGTSGEQRVVAVNYANHQSQCYVRLPVGDGALRLEDRMGPSVYDRDGQELRTRGLYLDVPAWAYHVFELVGV